MSAPVAVVETTEVSYKILKWIGGGGVCQVFKVLRDNKVGRPASRFKMHILFQSLPDDVEHSQRASPNISLWGLQPGA